MRLSQKRERASFAEVVIIAKYVVYIKKHVTMLGPRTRFTSKRY